jgi:2-keto-4-pentenoate hydratase/2-oxohepta-3-ene-1,7-dioic acid hydratase in catechol pathway
MRLANRGGRAWLELFSERTDYEAGLVVVIGRAARGVSEERALAHLAGYCVGQDISDRRRYLVPGDVIESEIEGIGPLVNRCVEAGVPRAEST